MMLFLTGASSSISKGVAPQDDVSRSLGGFISSSPVPNGVLNGLFDLISMKTLKDRNKETIAVALVNKFDFAVKDVSLKLVSGADNICNFKIAAQAVGEDYAMEHINNRYSEPITAEFHDATFYRGSVDVEIEEPGVDGEEIYFDQFDVTAVISGSGYDATFEAVNKAFSTANLYRVKRITEKVFRVESKDDNVVNEPFPCTYLTTENAKLKFLTEFDNHKKNEVFLVEQLEPNQAIGIWIQREISEVANKTNQELLDDYDAKRELEKIEEVELVINYNLIEETE